MPTAKFVGSEKRPFAKRMLAMSFFATVLGCLLVFVQLPEALASEISNGTYSVEYEMLQADSDSVSIANDYFEKPAILTVDDENQYIQFTVSRSEWVKVLTAADGESFVDVEVVSEDPENDQRVIAFQVDGDISQPVLMQMHVKIEDMVPAYDHKYTVRLDFDLETVQVTDAPAVVIQSTTDEGTGNNVIVYILIAILTAAIILVVRKFSTSKK